MKFLPFTLLFLFASTAFCQQIGKDDASNKLFQMTGIVITDSLYRVPFATVGDISTKRGAIADFYGYFAIAVHPGDSLVFSSLGFKRKFYVVPDTIPVDGFSLVQVLEYDTITVDPVDVYPWPSREQFANYFVNMDLDDDDIVRAKKRLTPQEMAFVGSMLVSDGASSYSAYRQRFYKEMYSRGQTPQNNILNPAAWNEFLRGLGTGRYRISP